MPSWMNGIALAMLAVVVLVGGRFAVALGRDEEPRKAAEITSEAVTATAGGAFAVGMMGLVEFADLLGAVFGWLGMHPFASSNGILAGIGALGAWLGIGIGWETWLGLGIAVPGLVMLLVEVGDD